MLSQTTLDQLKSNVYAKYTIITVGSILAGALILKCYAKRKREAKKKSYPKDVVILHQFPKFLNAHIPSPSPFVLKLETWLRMNKINYQNEHGFTFGSKGKLPFITYNGEEYADSDFIIQFLSTTMNKDFSKSFSARDQGIARAFSKMTEESLLWVLALHRFVFDHDPATSGYSKLALVYIGMVIKKRAKAQGYGLHSREEVYSIGRRDLKAINDVLEGNKFLLGDKPCNEDAAVFGVLCELIYTERGPMHHFIKNECPNIVAYVENMKSIYWPDWNQRINHKPKD